MDVDLVPRRRRVDVDPGLDAVVDVGPEVLGFADLTDDLQDAADEICELRQDLQVVPALPAGHVRVGHAGRVGLAQPVNRRLEMAVHRLAIVEHAGPDQGRKQRAGHQLH
jgi:hypothetical protein